MTPRSAMPPSATAAKVATTMGSCRGSASKVRRPKMNLVSVSGIGYPSQFAPQQAERRRFGLGATALGPGPEQARPAQRGKVPGRPIRWHGIAGRARRGSRFLRGADAGDIGRIVAEHRAAPGKLVVLQRQRVADTRKTEAALGVDRHHLVHAHLAALD